MILFIVFISICIYTCYQKVLSESVGKALLMTGQDEVTETAHFVMMMDKYFDCLNVHNYTPMVIGQESLSNCLIDLEMTSVLRYAHRSHYT